MFCVYVKAQQISEGEPIQKYQKRTEKSLVEKK